MRKKGFVCLLLLLITVILFAGCTGGSGGISATDEQKINAVFDQFERAMKRKDAEQLADLLTYPFYGDGVELQNREQAVAAHRITFALIEEIHEHKFTNRIITVNVPEATVETTEVAKITSMLFGYDEMEQDCVYFVRKIGGKWRLSGYITVW